MLSQFCLKLYRFGYFLLFVGAIAAASFGCGTEAITQAGPVWVAPHPPLLAYDIDLSTDRQRKAEVKARYGEEAAQIVDEAIANNHNGPNNQYKIKSEDSPIQKIDKLTNQVKHQGLVGER